MFTMVKFLVALKMKENIGLAFHFWNNTKQLIFQKILQEGLHRLKSLGPGLGTHSAAPGWLQGPWGA